MNIFNKVTLQSMRKSRTRTIVTVIGVVLSSAMITAVAAFTVSLQNYLVNGAVQKYGGWHVEFLDVTSSFIQEQANDRQVAGTAAIENIGYAVLDGGRNPDKPYLFIAGFGEEAFDTLPLNLVSGRLPMDGGEILIPSHVEANGGVKVSVGDRLSLAVGDRMDAGKRLGQHDPFRPGGRPGEAGESFVPVEEKTYRVAGIYERPGFEEFSAPGYTVITAADHTGPAEASGSLSVFITLKNARKVHAYTAGAAGKRAYVFNEEVLRFLGLSTDKVFTTLLYWVGGILIALIMLGSIFLIYNSFTISLNDRMRQFGILLSVGATKRQLQNSVLFEGLCIGAIGIPIGILIGIPSIQLVLAIVAENFRSILNDSAYGTVPLTLSVSVPAIAAAAAVSMVTILISAYIPARKAAGTPVMECIRQTNEVKIEAQTVRTSNFLERIYGLEGALALKNFKRDKGRYRSIVLSLTLSVVLFVSADAFGTCLKQAAESSVMDTDYDICFYSQDMDEGEMFRLYEQLRTVDGIYESSYQAVSPYVIAVRTRNFSDQYRESAGVSSTEETVDLAMDIQFIEDRVYLEFIESLGLSPEEYTGRNGKMTAVAKAKNQGGARDGKNGLIDMFTDRSMDVSIAPISDETGKPGKERTVSITFVDTIPVDTLPRRPSEVKPYVFLVVAPYGLKAEFDGPGIRPEMGLTFLSESPSRSVEEMKAVIEEKGITSDYTLYNVHKMLEQNRSILFVVNVFSLVFAAMITLIAAANVFNTVSTNIRLRRRELAMLRSVGMSDRGFHRMMNFECALYGMRTLMLGFPWRESSPGSYGRASSLEEPKSILCFPGAVSPSACWGCSLWCLLP